MELLRKVGKKWEHHTPKVHVTKWLPDSLVLVQLNDCQFVVLVVSILLNGISTLPGLQLPAHGGPKSVGETGTFLRGRTKVIKAPTHQGLIQSGSIGRIELAPAARVEPSVQTLSQC